MKIKFSEYQFFVLFLNTFLCVWLIQDVGNPGWESEKLYWKIVCIRVCIYIDNLLTACVTELKSIFTLCRSVYPISNLWLKWFGFVKWKWNSSWILFGSVSWKRWVCVFEIFIKDKRWSLHVRGKFVLFLKT